MTRRRTSLQLRCWQIVAVGLLLYGTAVLLAFAAEWIGRAVR